MMRCRFQLESFVTPVVSLVSINKFLLLMGTPDCELDGSTRLSIPCSIAKLLICSLELFRAFGSFFLQTFRQAPTSPSLSNNSRLKFVNKKPRCVPRMLHECFSLHSEHVVGLIATAFLSVFVVRNERIAALRTSALKTFNVSALLSFFTSLAVRNSSNLSVTKSALTIILGLSVKRKSEFKHFTQLSFNNR